ncbi:MAG TPA: glutathione transferase [Kofleriaceae bacterium]|nr:glutathione transferase [Kofleriaceae bacterium]
MSELTLYGDAAWESPWVFHAMVALDELKVKYTLEPIRRPIADDLKGELKTKALLPFVPALVHGDFWLTESSAISEYLAEQFAPPSYPRILPADARERARARQVISWLRTSIMGLRNDRPTTSVFMKPVTNPLSEKGRADADELVRVASQLVAPGKQSIASEWCIADADLALALMRLVGNNDSFVPKHLVDYALATWGRRSVLKYLSYIPTTH